jgi:hypothetical protein
VTEQLWQIFGPRFTAGLVTQGEVVVDAAPILRSRCLGRTRAEVRAVAQRLGWTIRFVYSE